MRNERDLTWILAAGVFGFLLGVITTALVMNSFAGRRAAEAARESDAERLEREARDARQREAENRRLNAIIDEDSPIQPPRPEPKPAATAVLPPEGNPDAVVTGTDRNRVTRPRTDRTTTPDGTTRPPAVEEADKGAEPPAEEPTAPAAAPGAVPAIPASRPGSSSNRTPVPPPGPAPSPAPLPPRR